MWYLKGKIVGFAGILALVLLVSSGMNADAAFLLVLVAAILFLLTLRR